MSSIQPQPTGFGGSAIKPFKPSSSFGASLLEALPTIPQGATPPSATPANATPTSSTLSTTTNANSPPPSNPSTGTTMFQLGALNSQTGGLGGLGSGAGFSALQPQPTGANPFRASMFPGAMPAFTSGTNGTSPFAAGMGSPSGLTTSISQPTGLGSGATTGFGSSLFAGKTSPFAATTTTPSFGANLFGTNAASTPSTGVPGAVPGQQQPQQPQQSQQTSFSLI
ncbi:hypothetical protein FRC02_011736 [Tulasnella sp. 418]|nr:hypothetical protein FRC02_011736 [Tulasnella sp. 418]